MMTFVIRTYFLPDFTALPMGNTNQITELLIIILAFVANKGPSVSLAPLPRDGNVVVADSALLHPGFALRGHSQAARLLELIDGSPGEVDLAALEGEHTYAEPAKQ